METVTDEISNPFGMDLPCEDGAVAGYGDANADFHVVGAHPGVHGGADTGVPFTGGPAGRNLQAVLHDVGLLAEPYADRPSPDSLFLSYLYPCVTDREPTTGDYADLERFLDAELRAINAHVLLPVGDAPLAYVLREHTTKARKLPARAAALHARQVRGRGFLVVPVAEPATWDDRTAGRLRDTLAAVLASDYRQTKGVATTVG